MKIMKPPTEIPIIVDAMKAYQDFSLVRYNYLSVECDSHKEGWMLNIGGEELPFLMLGLVAQSERLGVLSDG